MMTFDEYWVREWKPTGQPAVFDAAMRELAEKAWRAAMAAGAATCDEIALRHQQTEGSYAAGKKAGAFECAEVLRGN